MKMLKNLLFAFVMIMSIAFVGGTLSSDNSFSASAQTATARRTNRGIARRTYGGGKYVVRRSWDGTKYVSRKVWTGSKWTAKKTYKTGRKVVSRTKKIIY